MTQATEQATETAIVNRRYDPYAPVGSARDLQSLLEANKNRIAVMLPKHITPERLVKTMMVAQNRNPTLLQCTQSSIVETINRAAELGLDLSGTLGEAYPVPFNNKIKVDGREEWVMQCQLIIGYRGMEKLAWQSGEIESIDAEVVCKGDHFIFKKGTTVLVEWSPKIDGDRGEPIGAYACVGLKSGGKLARFLTASDIDKIRNSSKSKDSPAWKNWWSEMARKCALKRTLKDAPLSTEKYVRALEVEDEDILDVVSVTPSSAEDRPRSLAQRMNGGEEPAAETGKPKRSATRTPDPEPEPAPDNDEPGQEFPESTMNEPEQEKQDPPAEPEPDQSEDESAALDKLISQGDEAFSKALFEKARELSEEWSPKIATAFKAGVNSYTLKNGRKRTALRALWMAVVGGKFKDGEIVK